MGDWFPNCDCECDPTQEGCDDTDPIDGSGGTDPDPTDPDVDPTDPDGTEEDPGTIPGGGGGGGGEGGQGGGGTIGGGGGGSVPPPGSGSVECEAEPALTGASESTASPEVNLGTPESSKIGTGIYASGNSVVDINSPVVIGCYRRGVESRNNAFIYIPNSIIRGGEFGLISAANATISARGSVVCRTGGVHAEHAAVMMVGRSLLKNNRDNQAADGSFVYMINTELVTTQANKKDKAYGLLTKYHLHGSLNSSFEVGPSTVIEGDLGSRNIKLTDESVIEGEPTVE